MARAKVRAIARVAWAELPAAVRVAVGAQVGPVLDAAPVADGLTCAMAEVLTTSDGRVFVKGVPVSQERGVAAQSWEVAVNPLVAGIAPLLLTRIEVAGWDVLVFEHIEGRHADLSPPSPDVPLVADALRQTQQLTAGGLAPRLADRFAGFLDAGEQSLLAGDALLHTDTNPHNFLIGGGRAHVVDWAMVASGPAWVDVAYLMVRLMEADWTAAQALEWAGQFPSWRGVDPVAVRAFVRGACRQWESIVGTVEARPGNGRYAALLGATEPAAVPGPAVPDPAVPDPAVPSAVSRSAIGPREATT
ncbi:phosphotransferase family protein [Streptomyces sp. CA-111067]|uniref:phosphotransferase family protein n=1 Tax=Streptomyces sp. CA-111067 TaxID=3240046 RepID=UPI003D97E68B